MKFKITKATEDVVETGKRNAGQVFFRTEITIDGKMGMFMSNKHNRLFFPASEEATEMWRKCIAENTLPEFPGKYVIVKTPAYYAKDQEGNINTKIKHTEMKVLVIIDPDTGEAVESAQGIAMQVIDAMMELAPDESQTSAAPAAIAGNDVDPTA